MSEDITVVKFYDKRGPYQLVRYSKAVPIPCRRCGQDKKSTLVANNVNEGVGPYCNGCYGKILSEEGL